jgi:hypothetical protein
MSSGSGFVCKKTRKVGASSVRERFLPFFFCQRDYILMATLHFSSECDLGWTLRLFVLVYLHHVVGIYTGVSSFGQM